MGRKVRFNWNNFASVLHVCCVLETRFKLKHSLDSDEEDEKDEVKDSRLGDEDLAAQEDSTIVRNPGIHTYFSPPLPTIPFHGQCVPCFFYVYRAHRHACVCIHTPIHTHKHKHIHTYTHSCIYIHTNGHTQQTNTHPHTLTPSQRFDDGIQVTPFNLSEEMEEG